MGQLQFCDISSELVEAILVERETHGNISVRMRAQLSRSGVRSEEAIAHSLSLPPNFSTQRLLRFNLLL